MGYVVLDSQWKIKGTYGTLREINTLYGLDVKKEDTEKLTLKKGKRVIKEEDVLDKLSLVYEVVEETLLDKYSEQYTLLEDRLLQQISKEGLLQVEIEKLTNEIDAEKGRRLMEASKLKKYKELLGEIKNDLTKLIGEGEVTQSKKEDDDVEENEKDLEEKAEEIGGTGDDYTELDLPKDEKVWEEDEIKKEGEKETKKRRGYVDFIKILHGNQLPMLKELKGKKAIQTKNVAVLSNLEEHDVQYLVHTILKGMGTLPTYTNTKIISPSEALWVIIASRAKREGYTERTKTLQKATLNGKDFYNSWITQKGEIEQYLS